MLAPFGHESPKQMLVGDATTLVWRKFRRGLRGIFYGDDHCWLSRRHRGDHHHTNENEHSPQNGPAIKRFSAQDVSQQDRHEGIRDGSAKRTP